MFSTEHTRHLYLFILSGQKPGRCLLFNVNMVTIKSLDQVIAPRLSCIILSHNSEIDKGNSVFHCLLSVLSQTEDYFEVILVENSPKIPPYILDLKRKVSQWNKKRSHPVSFSTINNPESYSSGKSRNIGASIAKGEVLVFLDDDTIVVDQQAFTKVEQLSREYDYAFGAKRLWTLRGYFTEKTNEILNSMEKKDYASLMSHSGDPLSAIRPTTINNPILSSNTFIANFGFCKRGVFNNVAGFPDFPGYGFEDDYLMFKLYKAKYRFTLLNNISVVHVTHALENNKASNLHQYFSALIRSGYYWFHVELLFRDKFAKRDLVLEKLSCLHYDKRIEQAFQEYRLASSLDLIEASQELQDSWAKDIRLDRISFAQAMNNLQTSDSLDSYIKNSKGDFDNLASIINSARHYDVIELNRDGKITPSFEFRFTTVTSADKKKGTAFIPTSELNQFPCDNQSRKRRKNLFKERYPFAEYLRFGIIGDDDLISLSFIKDIWAWPIILEKDKRLIKIIRQASPRFEVFETDVCDTSQIKSLPKIQTFITDPPYTLHGTLAFVTAGLHMLSQDDSMKEFYVILNPMMLGRHLEEIQRIFVNAGIHLSEVLNNFNQYELPQHFVERKRANNFLSSIKLSTDAVRYSSSSSLYIFKTLNPVIQEIESQIDYRQLYNHYT